MNAVDEIVAQASELPEGERAKIAAKLIEGLPASAYDVSDEEVERRRLELESGAAKDISLEELKAGLDL